MLPRIKYFVLSFAFGLMCIVPSSAWSAESFVGKENLPSQSTMYYDYEPVASSSNGMALMSLEDGISTVSDDSSVSSLSGADFVYRLSVNSDTAAIGADCTFYIPRETVAGITVGGYSVDVISPTPFLTVNTFYGSVSLLPGTAARRTFYNNGFAIPQEQNGAEFRSVNSTLFGSAGFSGPGTSARTYISCDLDISSLGETSSLEFGGLLSLVNSASPVKNDLWTYYRSCTSLGLYINGALVHTFYPTDDDVFDLSFMYDSSTAITSVTFRAYMPSSPYSGQDTAFMSVSFSSMSASPVFVASLSSLGKPAAADALDSNINNAQDLEGQVWENFNSKFSSLTVSITSGIASAATLLGGLFNDIWNTLGDVKLVYFAPLYFGLLFWILGRVRR